LWFTRWFWSVALLFLHGITSFFMQSCTYLRVFAKHDFIYYKNFMLNYKIFMLYYKIYKCMKY